ncbi:MAG TPA: VWA domain-containing protein, partial [Acidimicrobiales bacterium]|nr:VWA domain-containing protein [Acidimicrobiales bacterium]
MSSLALPEQVLAGGLFEVFAGFFGELRAAGVPLSTTEVLDAVEALRHLPLDDREALKRGLAAALVKHEGHWRTFEVLFDLYFSLQGSALALLATGAGASGAEVGEQLSASELADLAYRALMEGNADMMAALARAAVERYAGMEPGRPVGGSYYVFKTLRHLQADALLERLLRGADATGGLEGLVEANEYRRRLGQLRAEVAAEVSRRLVADRGAQEVARALRRPLPEDVDFMHLGREELASLQRAVQPLARKLAVHLARKRRRRNEGRLDFRATMRRSLSSGGVPAEPRFKARQRSKPELWALA